MFSSLLRAAVPALLLATLVACGGGGSDEPDDPVGPPPPTPTVTLTISPSVLSVEAGASGVVTASVVRGGGFAGDVTVSASGLPAGVTIAAATIPASAASAALAVSAAGSATVGASTVTIGATATGVSSIASQTLALTVTAPSVPAGVAPLGNLITGEQPGSTFGSAVAISADGSRVAVGAQNNNGSGATAGSVRVYQRVAGVWTQVGGDIDGEAAGDQSGISVAMSNDGNRVAIGAWLNSGRSPEAGHVRVFDFNGTAWVQVGGDIEPPAGTSNGQSVALSASGHRVVIGAPGRISSDGYASVYELSGTTWSQVGAAIAGSYEFGTAVDISDDGNRIAVGVPGTDGGDRPGLVAVYQWSAGAWSMLGSAIVGEANADGAGQSVSLSADGSRVAIGAPNNDDGGLFGGQVRVYEFVAGAWTQLGGDIDGVRESSADYLGSTVSLSADGTRLIASAPNMSRAKVYVLSAGAWTRLGGDLGGGARAGGVAISADGKRAIVGFENGNVAQVFSINP